ncbi:density-regulated protein homolog [Oppia nitens]|uniref:density-regulated protein homolog n=1 Tax=Oppia nitens TaxID=1686743 RepID=UPI0023DB3627|nr:density-regulated protein homolog [Oppia nitens]
MTESAVRTLPSGPQPGVKYPIKVLYCGECSLPVEYCEFYPNNAKCKEWLERSLPEVFELMMKTSNGTNSQTTTKTVTSDAGDDKSSDTAVDDESGAGGGGTVGEKRGRQKRGGKALVKTKSKGNVERYVKLARSNRGKKKYVTVVTGLSTYDIDLKDAAKFFASKFACGSSVTGADEIVIQGDVKDDMFDLLTEKWPEIDEDSIDDLGDIKK